MYLSLGETKFANAYNTIGEEEDEEEDEENESRRAFCFRRSKRGFVIILARSSLCVCFFRAAVRSRSRTRRRRMFSSSVFGKRKAQLYFCRVFPRNTPTKNKSKSIKPCGEHRRRRRESLSSSSRSSPRSSSSRTVVSFLLSMVTITTTATESCFKFHASERQRGTKIAFCILVSKERRGGVTSQRRTAERWWMTRCCRR